MMRVKWFGVAWPRNDYRAPICEDDADRTDVPVGKVCVGCREPVEDDDRGVMMSASLGVEGSWYSAEYGEHVCAYHIDCFLGSVIPDHDIGFTRKAVPVGGQ